MTRVTIASQFGEDFDQKLRAARPDVEVIPLPRANAQRDMFRVKVTT